MRIVFSLLLIVLANGVYSQSDNILTMTFSMNNGKTLSSFFDKTINLELPTEKGIYTKQQAKLVMTNFFNKTPVSSYKERHNGGGNGKALFHIGFFQSNEVKYRTYILYHMVQDKPQIIELRIESEE